MPMPSMADLFEPMSVGAVVLVGSVATITYLAVFLPHFWLGWWGGISDLGKYYTDVVKDYAERGTSPVVDEFARVVGELTALTGDWRQGA